MIIHKIALNGFRNYEWETADFSSRTNVITGENAQGKTNLLEAVYLLSSGKSFRTRFDRELIGFDFSEAEILAEVFSHEREQSIRIRMSPGQAKRITVNGVRKTATELSETVNTVLFCPDDLNLIKDGAAVRRKMMDQAISQIRPKYAALLTEFNRLYEHKTRILRDWREKPSLLDTLDSFSDALCRVSAQMIRYRASYMSRLNEAVKPIHADFSGKGEEIDLLYHTVSTVKDPFAPAKEIYYDICDHQEKHRQAELDSLLMGAPPEVLHLRDRREQPPSPSSWRNGRSFCRKRENIRSSCWTMCCRSWMRRDRNLSSTASAADRRSSPAAKIRTSPGGRAERSFPSTEEGSGNVSDHRKKHRDSG